MKKTLGFTLGLTAAVCAACGLNATELSKGKKDAIFVGPIEVDSSLVEMAAAKDSAMVLDRLKQTIDSQLTPAIAATRAFTIVERKRKDAVELEQAYAAVAADPDDDNAAKMGKMTGAKYILLPRIDGFDNLIDKRDYKSIDRSSTRRKLYVSATARVVDTTTGETLPDIPSVQMTEEQVSRMAMGDSAAGDDQVVVKLAKAVADRLCREVIRLLRPAKILAVTIGQVMINQGAPAGFKPGAKVEYYAFNEITDEDSGETFRNEILVGHGIISRADTKKSYADIRGENLGVAKGCLVKPAAATTKQAAPLPPSMPGGSFPESPDAPTVKPPPLTPGSADEPLEF